jgi:hypothetical protein
MRQKWLLQIVPAVLLASVAAAQTGTALSGPTMGLVFDASQSALRPIRGIPGAATFGDAVNPGFPLASATVSPRQDFALALRADDSSVVLARAGGGSAAVPGARPAPALMVFSPAGATAALYDSGAGRVQVLTGLPDAAAVQSDVDISALAGPVAALAVDDAGSTLFLAAGAAETVALYRIGMDGTSQFLASFRSVRRPGRAYRRRVRFGGTHLRGGSGGQRDHSQPRAGPRGVPPVRVRADGVIPAFGNRDIPAHRPVRWADVGAGCLRRRCAHRGRSAGRAAIRDRGG